MLFGVLPDSNNFHPYNRFCELTFFQNAIESSVGCVRADILTGQQSRIHRHSLLLRLGVEKYTFACMYQMFVLCACLIYRSVNMIELIADGFKSYIVVVHKPCSLDITVSGCKAIFMWNFSVYSEATSPFYPQTFVVVFAKCQLDKKCQLPLPFYPFDRGGEFGFSNDALECFQ